MDIFQNCTSDLTSFSYSLFSCRKYTNNRRWGSDLHYGDCGSGLKKKDNANTQESLFSKNKHTNKKFFFFWITERGSTTQKFMDTKEKKLNVRHDYTWRRWLKRMVNYLYPSWLFFSIVRLTTIINYESLTNDIRFVTSKYLNKEIRSLLGYSIVTIIGAMCPPLYLRDSPFHWTGQKYRSLLLWVLRSGPSDRSANETRTGYRTYGSKGSD